MTHTSLPGLSTTVYQTLIGDTTFMSLVTGVFDAASVPVNQAYPFVAFNLDEGPNNAFAKRGYDGQLTIDIWDVSTGFKTCQTILARMNDLLDQQSLTVSGMHFVYCLYDSAHQLNDPGRDGIRHMPVIYKTFVQE